MIMMIVIGIITPSRFFGLQLDEPGSPAAPENLNHTLDLRTPHHDLYLMVNIKIESVRMIIILTIITITAG